MGLPLGIDYERKKQRLQQELRMDYNRYMSQLQEHRTPHRASPLPKAQQAGPPSRREAATLRESRRGVRRALRLSRTKAPRADKDEGLTRQRAGQRRPVDRGSEDNDDDEEEEEYTRAQAGYEDRTLNSDSRTLAGPPDRRFEPSEEYVDPIAEREKREKRENHVGNTRAGGRSRALTNNDETEFATGLLIGRPDAEEVLQKKKERYRLELLEQIAEQRRNKKREKELELTVAATGTNDPEKRPDRIMQFGLTRRRVAQVMEPPAAAQKESYGGWPKLEASRPQPEQTSMAFQSPLLEYSAALGLGDSRSPNIQRGPAPHFPRAMGTPRIPVFPPHPPSTLPETYKSPYSDPHSYNRNTLDPHLPYYGQLPASGDGLPTSYWNLPPGGALSSQSGHHSSQSLHSGSNPTEPPTFSPVRPSAQAAVVDSGLGRFPADRARTTRERRLCYKEALDQQIQERQELRCLELEEKKRYEAQLEVDMNNHQPWGRGGGGAPLRDSMGNLLTDLKQMHKLNEEAYSNPEQRSRRAPTVAVHTAQQPTDGDGFSGSTHLQNPQFARGNVFAIHPTPQQLQDKYKTYLNEQGTNRDGARTTRERVLTYKEALDQQIQERQELRCLELEEKKRYEAQLEVDMNNHQPWGRGGGGAPLRDSMGNLLTDLKQMHKLNEEAYSNPEQRSRRAPTVAVHTAQQPTDGDGFSGSSHGQAPQFARDKLQQIQDKYKAYLKEQIEEKRRKQVEERERIRLDEEKEERRLAEQRACIQREYEEEQEKKKRKEMEQQAKNEEMIQLAMERRKEAERKKKEVEDKENESLRRHYEKGKQERLEEVHRGSSPPIPTLQRREGQRRYTPRPPTAESQRSSLSETSLSGLQSPPVPACRNQIRAEEDQRDVFRELSVLRRQLHSEKKRIEGHLIRGDSPLSDRHQKRSPVDVFDLARLRVQAPVRRPGSRYAEPSNLLRIHESLQLGHADGDSRAGSTETPRGGDEVGPASRRRRGYRERNPPLDSQWMTIQDDYLDLPPLQQNHYLRSVMGISARGSLLESESAFIDPLGNAFPVPTTPEQQKTPQLSARERRRLAKQTQPPQERTTSREPIGYPDFLQSDGTLNRGANTRGEGRRQRSSGTAMASSRHRNTAANLSDDEEEEDPAHSQASPRGRNHHSSMETVAMDPWLRPGTSDTLKRLMSGLSCSEWQAKQDPAPRDWDGPSTYRV